MNKDPSASSHPNERELDLVQVGVVLHDKVPGLMAIYVMFQV